MLKRKPLILAVLLVLVVLVGAGTLALRSGRYEVELACNTGHRARKGDRGAVSSLPGLSMATNITTRPAKGRRGQSPLIELLSSRRGKPRQQVMCIVKYAVSSSIEYEP